MDQYVLLAWDGRAWSILSTENDKAFADRMADRMMVQHPVWKVVLVDVGEGDEL